MDYYIIVYQFSLWLLLVVGVTVEFSGGIVLFFVLRINQSVVDLI